jgi:hypothetical protein
VNTEHLRNSFTFVGFVKPEDTPERLAIIETVKTDGDGNGYGGSAGAAAAAPEPQPQDSAAGAGGAGGALIGPLGSAPSAGV